MKQDELIAFVVENTWLPGLSHGWGNGYVAIPEGHPCYGLHYDEIHDQYDISLNGGLTYSDSKMTRQPKGTKGMWVVGFDTCHYDDTIEKWPDADTVMKEAESLKQQLEDLKLNH